MSNTRHFLTLLDFSPEELHKVLARAADMKQAHKEGRDQSIFPGVTLGMIFAKSSTRTRVSFEAGMARWWQENAEHRAANVYPEPSVYGLDLEAVKPRFETYRQRMAEWLAPDGESASKRGHA